MNRQEDQTGRTGGGQRWFDQSCSQAAFLLGGIGTGNVSVGSRGQLKDWEIFGQAGKGNYLPNTFFAIRVAEQDGSSTLFRTVC